MKLVRTSMVCVALLSFQNLLFAQNVRENAILHLNEDVIVSGETLLFSGKVVSASTGKLSGFSKFLYVEVIGEKGPVFQTKLALQDGVGQGDFFVSSLVPTGTYQVLAYTRWMRNFDDYFQTSIVIINPFDSFKKPTDESLKIAVFPEGGHLTQSELNKVVVRVTDIYGKGVSLKGRLADTEGQPVTFETNGEGYGMFNFVPTAQKNQLILEDENENLIFFPLPEATPVPTLQVSEERDVFRIAVNGESKEDLILRVYDPNKYLIDSRVSPGGISTLPKSQLRGQVVQATLFSTEGVLLSTRLIGEIFKSATTPQPVGTFKTRELVTLGIPMETCEASVSVRKVNSGNRAQTREWNEYLKGNVFAPSDNPEHVLISSEYRWEQPFLSKEVAFLPEVRQELMVGTLTSESGEALTDREVVYASTAGVNQTISTTSDKNGRFVLEINSSDVDHTRYLRVGDFEQAIFTPELSFLETKPSFTFYPVKLDSILIQEVTQRSVRNQVENSFYTIKKDSILRAPDWPLAFPSFDYSFVLDDYNRFPKMEEAFIEYIPTVAVRKRRDGGEFKIRTRFTMPYEYPSLILLDGVPVPDSLLLDFSPYKIKSIGVINNRLFMGPQVYDGLLSFETFQGGMDDFSLPKQVIKVPYRGLAPKKMYFTQGHNENSERVPDYRDQLFWDPKVSVSDSLNVEFFTSSSRGQFEMVVKGITPDGREIKVVKTFQVVD